jgi:hypothetical protein
MATTTTNFGWDIPQSTDLVKDGATAIAALGQDIDTALVDLKGGTTGQVLAKASGTDLDYSWVTTDDANAIQNSIVDAKGDLISATGNDTPARLAVGANGETLVADSSTSTGLKWALAPNFVGAFAYNTSSQTINNATQTIAVLDGEFFDTNGFHSTVTNTSRMTIPTGFAGIYSATATIALEPNATGQIVIYIFRNGNLYALTTQQRQNVVDNIIQVSTLMNLSDGDYVQMGGYQDQGSSSTIKNADIFYTNLQIQRIGS